MTDAANPLLDTHALPRFDAIRPEHVEPGIRALLDDVSAGVDRLEAAVAPTWEGVIEALERLQDRLGTSWGVVSHLMGVRNCDALRAAHSAMQPAVVELGLRSAQSKPIFDALQKLSESAAFSRLDTAQQRIVSVMLRDARLSGVALEGEARTRFNAIQMELAELQTQFSNHVLDATKAFSLWLREPDEVRGLPESARSLAAQAARAAGEPNATPEHGPWRLTLDAPSLTPALQHLERRDLREKLYRASIARASTGESDNAPLIARILRLRREQARLLGFASFAELSLATKMAPSIAAVEALQERLRDASYTAAQRELAELREFARAQGETNPLMNWDIGFWAERLREQRYAYSEEELRPYFALPRVLEGLFDLAGRLFGVRIRAADGEAPVWHPDVRFFRVSDAAGEPLAAFYLDPYSRPAEKRSGAWMDECVGRSRLFRDASGAPRLPVAYLVCNQTPPVGETPSLMTFAEVETLFHEFGHGLQHMLTRVEHGFAAGIRNVEWDAVELPSQFMENWCYHRPTLVGFARHWQTGAALPEALFEKLRAARTFRAGSLMLRQLHFGVVDLELHHRFDPDAAESPFDVERRIAQRTTVIPPLPEDRFLCSFSHIFAGGYAAGYYSYKWAEVLSADAFAAFEEAGLDDPAALAATGRRFRDTVLSEGGSRPAMQVFESFRGRAPDTAALLRHNGLALEVPARP
jgi:oligopeptidase A